MKTNLSKLIMLFIISFLVLSCEREKKSVNDNSANKEVFSTAEPEVENSLNDVLDEVKALAREHDRVVRCKIELVDGHYSLRDVRIIEEKEVSDFIIGGIQAEMGTDDVSGTIQVSCTLSNGDFYNTFCESGIDQYECVGRAVIGCINAGGCAETCAADLTVVAD